MKLKNPPYLQVACDQISRSNFDTVISNIPENNPKIFIEAGTPLIKRFGIDIIKNIKNQHPNNLVVADLKTLDVAALEVEIVENANGDAIAISGLANKETIMTGIETCKQKGILSILDMMNVDNLLQLLEQLPKLPDIVLFHRGIDAEGNQEHPWKMIKKIKNYGPLIAVAGGINEKTAQKALANGADILVIGRYLTAAQNPQKRYNKILDLIKSQVKNNPV